MKLISLTVTTTESGEPEFRDVVNFLWDFNLLFEISRLAVDPKYEGFTFTNHVFQRNGRPLDRFDRLRLVELREESPLKLKTVATASAGAAAALWVLVQSAQTLQNWPLQREKLKLEVRKTQLEVEKLERDAPHELQAGQGRLKIEDAESRRRSEDIRAIQKQLAFPPADLPQIEDPPELERFQSQLEIREALHQIYSVIWRFEKSPMRIEDVSVELIDGDDFPK